MIVDGEQSQALIKPHKRRHEMIVEGEQRSRGKEADESLLYQACAVIMKACSVVCGNNTNLNRVFVLLEDKRCCRLALFVTCHRNPIDHRITIMPSPKVVMKSTGRQVPVEQRIEPEPKPVLDPKIECSIWPTGDGQWAVGTLMLCERLPSGANAPKSTVARWKDADGVDYCLYPRDDQPLSPDKDPAHALVKPKNFSSAIFEIGCDVLIKAKFTSLPWDNNEGEAIALVRERAPSVPVPEVIHYWRDPEWERAFLVMRRVHGKTIDDAWFKISAKDQQQVLKEMAAHIKATADITAPRFQDPVGGPVTVSTFAGDDLFETQWGPRSIPWPGPFTADELREHMRKEAGGVEPPEMGSDFHFYHRDIGPANVILSGTDSPSTESTESTVHVAAIIDWEVAGFFPKFWIPFWIVSWPGDHGLSLTMQQCDEDVMLSREYQDGLNTWLRRQGFPNGHEFHKWWFAHAKGQSRVTFRREEEARAAGLAPIPTEK